MSLIPKEIESHYQQTRESDRLSGGFGELERLRTQSVLERYLPPAPGTIFDVGGAAGVYAFPLTERGYQVHLIDPVEQHLDQARSCASARSVELASITLGDARHLEFADRTGDAVLLLGPLYHLVEHSDRLRALREAHRILKPGGVLFAAAISRFASFIDGLSRGFFRDPEFRKIVADDLASGQHRNTGSRPDYFTTAYFHRPEQLTAEVSQAGFSDVQVLPVEGPAWSTAHFLDAWTDDIQRQNVLDFLALIEREPSIVGASAHLIAVARRQLEPAP